MQINDCNLNKRYLSNLDLSVFENINIPYKRQATVI